MRLRNGIALLVVMLGTPAVAAALAFEEPIDVKAMRSPLAARSPLTGIARAGDRLVAVGARGHILVSDDVGKGWTQVPVPVSVDLTAVHFPTAQQGWAVGHCGVVLHSGDGGRTWERQLDGKQAAALTLAAYEKRAADGDREARRVLEEAKRLVAEGGVRPFLDVWFEDERTGFVVGAYGLILRTADGGRSWDPWLERVENPSAFHLYSVRGAGGEVFIAGEQGLLLRLDRKVERFLPLSTGYPGTFFGALVRPGSILVFGLRGNAFASADGGRSWVKSQTGVETGLEGGTVMPDGRIVLVSHGGQIIVSADDGKTFSPIRLGSGAPLAAVVAAGRGVVAVAGSAGLSTATLD